MSRLRLITPSRALALLLAAASFGSPAAAMAESAPDSGRAWEPVVLSQPEYASTVAPTFEVERDATDGETLAVAVWLPQRRAGGPEVPARLPVVIDVTPYRSKAQPEWAAGTKTLVEHGYAYVQGYN